MNKEKELKAALEKWRDSLRQIGEICNTMMAEGTPEMVLRSVCSSYGMGDSAFTTATRWARGDYGSGCEASILIKRVPHSRLAMMDSDIAKDLATKPLRVFSRPEGRVVTKLLKDFNKQEAAFITERGLPPIAEQTRTEPAAYACRAGSVVEDDNSGGVVFISRGNHPVRMRVPILMLEKASQLMSQVV
jgi:hypothetical protein